jgi:hypothetical protein
MQERGASALMLVLAALVLIGLAIAEAPTSKPPSPVPNLALGKASFELIAGQSAIGAVDGVSPLTGNAGEFAP